MVENTPDPPKEEAGISEGTCNIPVIDIATDSEEEEGNGYEGYTMLPTDVADVGSSQEEEEDEESTEHPELPQASTAPVEPPTFERATADEIRAVWNTPHTPGNEPMNPDLTEEVLKAMKGFSLPSTAIPSWAKDVGEEDWKNHLLEKIRNGV